MTMMNILEEKGHLTRSKEGRAYRYEPIRPKSQVISGMVEDFVGKVFEGSARPLVLSLVQDRKLSKKDLEEIARIIEEVE
jgi:BlaI family penicillinase repressor